MNLYEGLRVTDVVDGLDYNGYHNIGQVSNEIRPLYRDINSFSHRCVGFANTLRMLPTNERRDLPGHEDLDNDTFADWEGDWYGRHYQDPNVHENDVVVIEATGLDVGTSAPRTRSAGRSKARTASSPTAGSATPTR